MSRAEASGDQRVIAGKIAARYDPDAEDEVVTWFKQLLDFDVERGMMGVMNSLKNGQALVKLAAKIREGTPNCPPKASKMRLKANTLNAPFKQMENIQVFLTFAENYGVHKNSLFPTGDLFEGRNLAAVLSCIQALGSETQRQKYNGPTCGPKPTTENLREFSAEQIAAGKNVIGLQAGTNKCASQSGMSMGAARHVADIRADDMDKAGQAILGGQMGFNKGASQSGMAMGAVRHVSDIRADDMDKEGQSVLGGQMGFTGGASQKGMSMGAARHAADIRADDMDKAGMAIVGGQMGFTGGASQKGMAMGAARHAADIRADDAIRSTELGLQMGSNKGASQAGMSMGSVRHVADMKTGEASREGSNVIGLQMGKTSGTDSQSGMSYGGRRDITKK